MPTDESSTGGGANLASNEGLALTGLAETERKELVMAPTAPGPRGSCCVVVCLGPSGPVVAGPRAPFLRADDLGVFRGDGVFERFLVRNGQPRHLGDHLARLAHSAGLMELPVPGPDEWQAAVTAATRAWGGPEEWEMRLVCTRGPEEGGPPTAYVLGQELTADVRRKRCDGIAAVTISREMPSWRAGGSPWLLLGAKTLSYAVNLSAQRCTVPGPPTTPSS